jgi:hypothetical protein
MAIGMAEICRTKNAEIYTFYQFLYLFARIFRRSDDFLANFRENKRVVGVYIVLLASLLMQILLLRVSLLLLTL